MHLRLLAIGIVLLAFLIRLFLNANTPLSVLYHAGHDDGWFISRAINLLTGNWLGPFNQYTLMKGPGYPAFVALSAASGVPLTVCHGLLQFLAIGVTAYAVGRISGQRTIGWSAFCILAFLPACYDPRLQRVLRDQIYWAQTLLFLSTAAIVLLAPPATRLAQLALSTTSGLVQGWTWLTREEGLWLMPALILLIVGELLRSWLAGRAQTMRLALAVGGVLAGFATVQIAFMTANHVAYGSFTSVDFNEPNFQAALRALQSIDDGHRIDYVPVNVAALDLAAKQSPTFAPVAGALMPGGAAFKWERSGCTRYKATCGNIAGGWFVWALRDAAALNGFYESPAIASEKFGLIADEIKSACRSGALTCRAGIFSYIPPMTWAQWASVPEGVATAMQTVLMQAPIEPTLRDNVPGTTVAGVAVPWYFLNYPKIVPPAGIGLRISGWFHDPRSSVWPEIRVVDANGNAVKASITRAASPDIVAEFGNPGAGNNRFIAEANCSQACSLNVRPGGGPPLTIPLVLSTGASSRTTDRGAVLYIDSIVSTENPALLHDKRSEIALLITNWLGVVYSWALPVLVALGALSFAATLIRAYFRRQIDAVTIAAMACYALVAARIAIVAIVDASSFPAIRLDYLVPATYAAAVAAILSISAFLRPLSAKETD